MKQIVVLFVGMIMFASVFAQEQQTPVRTPADEAAKHTAMLERRLHLSAEQVDTVYKIHLFYANLRRELVGRPDNKQLFEQMIHELKKILTPEQIERFDQMLIDGKRNRSARFIQNNEDQNNEE